MRVFVLCNCYQEAGSLPRMIESVREAFIGRADVSFVFVDGKYPDHAGESDFSTDDTKEIAEREGAYLPVVDNECEKRTAGLRLIDKAAREGDWVLYIDADETITGIFGWPERVGLFSFTRKTHIPVTYGRCRLYRWEPGLHFKNRHYDLYDASGELVASLENAPDFQVVGTGDHYEKSRTPEKQAYYRVLRDRETSPWEKVDA